MGKYNGDIDYAYLSKAVFELGERYPFLKTFSIGQSAGGREIFALSVGSMSSAALMAGAFHGSEHITVNVLLKFAEQLCFAIDTNSSIEGINVKKGLYGRGAVIIPCINPDGCEISIHGFSAAGNMADKIRVISKGDYIHYNSNLRGVDINHNFDADWETVRKKERKAGIFGPSKTRYGGPFPESEPETAALCEFCRTNYISHAVAFHTQGEVIYWTFGDKTPPKSEQIAQIMATSSGYALDFPETMATGGGFKDWFIKEFNRPAFTVELGIGKNPLPIEDADELYLRVREMLMLTTIM